MTKEVTKYVPISGMRIVVEAPKTYTFVHWDDYERLRDALRGLSNMYSRTWDRVDGALMMMPDNIERFEKAHAAAQSALGEPVDGDAHEPLEQRMSLEHYRTENGKLRKAMADLMHKCPRCRAEAEEALRMMSRKKHHPRCELMQPHGHEPPKCTCPSERIGNEQRG